jgi:hypothetical protein
MTLLCLTKLLFFKSTVVLKYPAFGNTQTVMRHPIGAFRSSLGFDSEDLKKPPHILAHLQGTQNPDTKPTLQKS